MSSVLWVVQDGSFYVGNWTVVDGSFYVGTWNVQPATDAEDSFLWLLPNDDEHYTQTGSPEDLNALPENIDVFPEDTQYCESSSEVWTVQAEQSSSWYILQGF